jgi:alkanesulfonate monooxygenase SsuD/methylene tetrahydromethanopterin reductase-like flavin-dependent oxidoreductase (luciferase family)
VESYFCHHMPWLDYPAGDVPADAGPTSNIHFNARRGADLYARYLDELEYAAVLGYDGVCVNEAHQNAFGGLIPSPNLMAAMLVRRIANARLVILGNCLPLRNNPLRVAEELAMLDVVSRGRVISGFVRGSGVEYFGANVNPTFSQEMFYEAHDLIRRAWTSTTPFEHLGRHYQFRHVNIWPRPYSTPHPPIWIPSAGSAETVTFAAERGYRYVSIIAPVERVKSLFALYRSTAERHSGEPVDPSLLGHTTNAYVSDDQRRAEDEASELLERGNRHFCSPVHLLLAPGYVSDASYGRFLETRLGQISATPPPLAGTPQRVADQLIAEYDALGGFGFILTGINPGGPTATQTRTHMRLFVEQVMPRLRTYHEQRTERRPAAMAMAGAR